jgi:hypothetical protein
MLTEGFTTKQGSAEQEDDNAASLIQSVLPIICPWYLSSWHHGFLLQYFAGEREYDERWLSACLGFTLSNEHHHGGHSADDEEKHSDDIPPISTFEYSPSQVNISPLGVHCFQRFNIAVLFCQVVNTLSETTSCVT